MVPVNEVTNEGQPRLFIGNLPPSSVAGAPVVTEPRIYFGERDTDYVVVGAKQAEFDYPTGEGDDSAAAGTETYWTGTTGVKLDSTLMRLLFSLRFRDLDLLISDQVTGNSQLLFHRSLTDRLRRIAPFLRFDKDPYLVVDGAGPPGLHPGRVHHVRPVPERPGLRPAVAGRDRDRTVGLQLHPQQRQDHDRRLRRHDALLRRRSRRPDHPRLRGRLPDALHLDGPDAGRPARPPARPRGPVQRPDADLRALSRHRPAAVLPQRRPVDGAHRHDERTDAAVRGVLRRHAHAGRVERGVPPAPADGSQEPAEHDRLDRGPQRRAELRRHPGLPLPSGIDRVRAGPDRGADRPGPDHQPADLAVEPVGQQGHPREPHRRPARRLADLPPAGLPPIDRRVVPGVPADRRRLDTKRGVGSDPRGVDQPVAQGRGGRHGPATVTSPSRSPPPGPSASPGTTPAPTPSSGPVGPLPTDVPGLIAYAKLHFDQAQAALRAGDFARYGEEIARVQAALDRLDALAPGLGLAPGASASPAP